MEFVDHIESKKNIFEISSPFILFKNSDIYKIELPFNEIKTGSEYVVFQDSKFLVFQLEKSKDILNDRNYIIYKL